MTIRNTAQTGSMQEWKIQRFILPIRGTSHASTYSVRMRFEPTYQGTYCVNKSYIATSKTAMLRLPSHIHNDFMECGQDVRSWKYRCMVQGMYHAQVPRLQCCTSNWPLALALIHSSLGLWRNYCVGVIIERAEVQFRPARIGRRELIMD